MAKTPLFQNWSWKRTLPEPFDKEDAVSTASYSKYCIGSTKKATLHSAALSAILAYWGSFYGLIHCIIERINALRGCAVIRTRTCQLR